MTIRNAVTRPFKWKFLCVFLASFTLHGCAEDLPSDIKFESPNFTLFARKGDTEVCQDVLIHMEAHRTAVTKFLGLQETGRITYYKLRDGQDTAANGCEGPGGGRTRCFRRDRGVLTAQALDEHELVHAYLAHQYDRLPIFLAEGFAVSLSCEGNATNYFGKAFKGTSDDFLRFDISADACAQDTLYDLAGRLVSYLFERHSTTSVMEFAHALQGLNLKAVPPTFARFFNESFDEVFQKIRRSDFNVDCPNPRRAANVPPLTPPFSFTYASCMSAPPVTDVEIQNDGFYVFDGTAPAFARLSDGTQQAFNSHEIESGRSFMHLPKGRYTLVLYGQKRAVGKSLSLSQFDVETKACDSPSGLPLQDGLTSFSLGLANVATPAALMIRVPTNQVFYISEVHAAPSKAAQGGPTTSITPSSRHDISLCKSCDQPLSDCIRPIEFRTFRLETPGDTIVRIGALSNDVVAPEPTTILFRRGI